MRTLALGLSFLWMLSPVLAQQGPPTETRDHQAPSTLEAGVETDTVSVYVHRGMVYSDGPVTQSMAWISKGGLHLYGWSNVAVPAVPGARRLDEVDLGASYAFERGDLTLEPAVDVYLYRLSESEAADGLDAHTAEVSVTVSYAMGGATLFNTHVVDAASYRGAYYGELGASYERALSPGTSLGFSARVGWASGRYNRGYLGLATPGPGLMEAGVSLTRKFGRHLYVRSHAELTTVPHGGLRAHVARPTVGRFGVAVGIVR